MPGSLQPLVNNQKIVDANGNPTEYFIRWAQQRQIDISDGITAAQAQQLIDDWAAARMIVAGFGLDGGGPLSSDVTIDLNAALGDLSDVDFSTPPTDQQVIVYDDVSHTWIPADQSGGGGGASGIAAFVNFKWTGSAVVINSASNVASVTRSATGYFRVTFTTPLLDAFYYVGGQGKFTPFADQNWLSAGPNRSGTQSAALCDIITAERYNGTASDPTVYCSVIFINDTSAVGPPGPPGPAGPGISDAPSDGVTYGRINATWAAAQPYSTVLAAYGMGPTPSAFFLTLVDDANAAASRATLGLGGSATLNVGTGAGTVAAGDDARITGAAQTANNLSDLTSAVTARTNLGLGTAATTAASAYVQKTGDTMTGNLTITNSGGSSVLAVKGDTSASLNIARYSTNNGAPSLQYNKARGTALSPTIVSTNDQAALFQFYGYSGSGFLETARLTVTVVDPTPSTTAMGGRYQFYTTPSGGTVITERLRLDENGLSVGGANIVVDSNRAIRLRSYTFAGLPAATIAAGQVVYCTNPTGGAGPVYSDGTIWRNMDKSAA